MYFESMRAQQRGVSWDLSVLMIPIHCGIKFFMFLHTLSLGNIHSSLQVIAGVNIGGVEAAVESVKAQRLPSASFKFFSGCVLCC